MGGVSSGPRASPGAGVSGTLLILLAVSPGLRILQPGTNEGVSFLGALDFHEHEALGARPGLSGRPFVETGVLSYLSVKISSSKVSSFTVELPGC